MRQLVESITGILILFSTGQCVSQMPTGQELFDQQQMTAHDGPIQDDSQYPGPTFASTYQRTIDRTPFAGRSV